MAPRHDHPLEVVALSDHQWRICDRGVEDDDARRILAYIEKRDGWYEVMSLKPVPSVCGRFCTFHQALECVKAELGRTDVTGAQSTEGALS